MDDEWQRLRQMLDQRIADVGAAVGGDEAYRSMVSTELTKIRGWMIRLEKSAPRPNPPIQDFEVPPEWFAEMMRQHQAQPAKMSGIQKIAVGLLFTLFFLSISLMAWVWTTDVNLAGKILSVIPVWSFRPRANWFEVVVRKR